MKKIHYKRRESIDLKWIGWDGVGWGVGWDGDSVGWEMRAWWERWELDKWERWELDKRTELESDDEREHGEIE